MHRCFLLLFALVACSCGGAGAPAADEQPGVVDAGVSERERLEQQLAEAERQNRELLEAAIAKFEQFLAEKPESPEFTPDAMLRLSELYRDRFVLDKGDFDSPDLARARELHRAILDRFPDYRYRDTVLYLLGADLRDAGRIEDALVTLRALVCANRYPYGAPPSEATAESYADCRPRAADSLFVPEAWFLIGDIHFESDGAPDELELAEEAYSRVPHDAGKQLGGFALYKRAWTCYRLDRYADAVGHFSTLLELFERDPKAGAAILWPEAVQYLAICLVEDDWDLDGEPDEVDGLSRLQDPELIDQQATWTSEVCHRLGTAYLDLAREQQAIRVLEHCLSRPDLAALPEAQTVRSHLTARELADLVGRLVDAAHRNE
jgi:tetratricopeptide (TPR) repeat protein